MYIQCTFHVRLSKVLSQLPDLQERSKPSMLDYSKHQKNGLDHKKNGLPLIYLYRMPNLCFFIRPYINE